MADPVRKTEHRQHVRHPIMGKVRILREDADGQGRVCAAELVDISIRGMRILVDIQMTPRTYVTVNDQKMGVMGRGSVRYCRFEKGKYAVGLEFSGGTGWNPAAGS
jgi:hypothetical protein